MFECFLTMGFGQAAFVLLEKGQLKALQKQGMGVSGITKALASIMTLGEE